MTTAKRVTPTINFPTKILVLFTAIINFFKPLILFSSDDFLAYTNNLGVSTFNLLPL
jgi:hypothetical protein